MSGLTLTVTREVSPEEVDDFVELIDFSRSPWFKEIATIIGGTSYLVESEKINPAREWYGNPGGVGTERTQVSSQQLLDAATKAQPELCCDHILTEGETLGSLCANDADIILQTAIFGRIVFG